MRLALAAVIRTISRSGKGEKMQDFNAIITRDGRVLHIAWATHNDIIERYDVPENTSLVRQNYWEYDILPPFVDGGGLQARGIEEPPEGVVSAAAKLTEDLCNWHQGRGLRSIPAEWGDVVEHVYKVRGHRAPKYLNGRGGVYFSGHVERLSDAHVMRILGSATIGRLEGRSVVETISGRARIEEAGGDTVIKDMRERASIARMTGRARVQTLCQSAVVEEMHDSTHVVLMFGASRVMGLYGRALCGRACDGVVFSASEPEDEKGLISSVDRYASVRITAEGECIYA